MKINKHQIPPIPKENPRPPKAKKPKDIPDAPLPIQPDIPKSLEAIRDKLDTIDKDLKRFKSK